MWQTSEPQINTYAGTGNTPLKMATFMTLNNNTIAPLRPGARAVQQVNAVENATTYMEQVIHLLLQGLTSEHLGRHEKHNLIDCSVTPWTTKNTPLSLCLNYPGR